MSKAKSKLSHPRMLGMALKAVGAAFVLAVSASPAMAVSENKKVEDEIRQLLKDPDSAKFGSLVKCTLTDNAWMGTLNAKNSYGGYTGMDEFYYERGEGLSFLSTADEIERAMFNVKKSVCFGNIKKDAPSPLVKASQQSSAGSKTKRSHR